MIPKIDMVLSDLMSNEKRKKKNHWFVFSGIFRFVCPWSITVTTGYTAYLLQNKGGKDFIDEALCYRVVDSGIIRNPFNNEDLGPLGLLSWESWTSVYLFFCLTTNITSHYICSLMNLMLYARYLFVQRRKEKLEQQKEQEQNEQNISTAFDEEAKPASLPQPQPCSEVTSKPSIDTLHVIGVKEEDLCIVQHERLESKSAPNEASTNMKKNRWLSCWRRCKYNLTLYPIVWVILHGVLVVMVQTYIDQVYCTDDILSPVIASTVVFTIFHIILSASVQ